MKRMYFIILLILTLIGTGCLFDSDSDDKQNEIKDTGTYAISVYVRWESDVPISEIETWPGSAYMLFIEIKPDSGFAGSVRLGVSSQSCLHPIIRDTQLTQEYPLTELEIYPDSTMETEKEYELVITATHDDSIQTISVPVVRVRDNMVPPSMISHLSRFIKWLQDNYPLLSLNVNEFREYAIFPTNVGGALNIFFSHDWVIEENGVLWPNYFFFLLRQRGVLEPSVAAYQYNLEIWTEFSPQDWAIKYTFIVKQEN